MPETFSASRKEKRWIVWTKPYTGSSYSRSGVSPDYVYTVIAGETWVNVLETSSFEKAKEKIIEYAGTLGLDNVKITRTVDLYTVMYPIS